MPATEKQKVSWKKDGGLHSNNCKCGRPWIPRWKGQFAYWRICPACGQRIKDCKCQPVIKT